MRSLMHVACGMLGVLLAATAHAREPAAGKSADPAQLALRDAVNRPPGDWDGHRFALSHQYPATKPTCDAPWLRQEVSFTDPNPSWEQWQAYIQTIVDYVWEDQDPNLPDRLGWKVAVRGKVRWFHVPWMAYDGQRGREYVHGLTNELSTAESTFRGGCRGSGRHHLPGAVAVDGVDPLFETWSVGMYNPCGAWSLGQAIPHTGVPATTDGGALARGLPFPEGTVVIKILNTTADEKAVPYLKGSTNWSADGHVRTSPTQYETCRRAVTKVHMVQMDIAVVDPRSPTRWVYSTLAYDGRLPGPTVRSRLVPLGVQWGSDGLTFPAVPQGKSRPLRETIHAPIDLPQHYGCQGRLAGVVDQANSSCVSCHMGAYAAPVGVLGVQGKNVPAIFTFDDICTRNTPDNQAYFSDYKYPAGYPSGAFKTAIPLDSSLQLAVAFQQYAVATTRPTNPPTCPPAGR
ncbi:hypothetical protein FBZ89_102131 [Nitrospirillum amazonense]|uniref:Cytochrome c domain-containing protein n=1 Tax=Nitrospirillum amazonense TaxID=28077 RepID=A0A560FP21_9PROT|nr:hypothetical protein [Nitrospirillum amazonense]TWB23378.1 hypothetical protein FBZ89_102131 [Nitrospirillum amazonense]